MKAAVARGKRITTCTVADPVPASGQVLVRTRHCGICGSDLHALQHGDLMSKLEAEKRSSLMRSPDWSQDVVMGHEFCAEVVDYGPDTQKTLAVGQLVCALPVVLDQNQMHTVGYSNKMPGGYGEYMLLNEATLMPVPAGLSSEQAALTEPMAVGIHAVARAEVGHEDVCLVIGCGSVGLAVIAALTQLPKRGLIVATDFSPTRRKLAESLGADVVVDPSGHAAYKQWTMLAEPAGYQPDSLATLLGMAPSLKPTIAFECVGTPGMINQVMQASPRATKIIIVGVCFESDQFQPLHGILSELDLRFAVGYTQEEFAQSLARIDDGKIDVRPLITDIVGIDQVADAFKMLAKPDQHAKILVAA